MNKKIITLLIIITLILIQSISVFAGTIDTDISIGGTRADDSSKTMIQRMLGMAQTIGSIISVVALIIIGFRYMFSSLEEKAAMKGVIIYYIVGAVLVFATSNILGIVYDVLWNLKI